MEKRKNKFYFLIIFLVFLSVLLFFLSFYMNSSLILEKKELVAKLSTGNVSGFDVNTSALTFGTISVGSSSQRTVDLENNYDFPIVVELNVYGDIKKFLVFEKKFYLDSYEVKAVNISTITLMEPDFGSYSGKLVVVFKKNVFW